MMWLVPSAASRCWISVAPSLPKTSACAARAAARPAWTYGIEAIGKARQRHANMSYSPGSSVTRFSGSAAAPPEKRGAREFVWSSLAQGAAQFQSAQPLLIAMVGRGGDRRTLGQFRDPDRCVPEALPGFRTIDSGTCLEDGDLHTGGRQLRGEKRARDARPDNDHVSFNVGHGWRQP